MQTFPPPHHPSPPPEQIRSQFPPQSFQQLPGSMYQNQGFEHSLPNQQAIYPRQDPSIFNGGRPSSPFIPPVNNQTIQSQPGQYSLPPGMIQNGQIPLSGYPQMNPQPQGHQIIQGIQNQGLSIPPQGSQIQQMPPSGTQFLQGYPQNIQNNPQFHPSIQGPGQGSLMIQGGQQGPQILQGPPPGIQGPPSGIQGPPGIQGAPIQCPPFSNQMRGSQIASQGQLVQGREFYPESEVQRVPRNPQTIFENGQQYPQIAQRRESNQLNSLSPQRYPMQSPQQANPVSAYQQQLAVHQQQQQQLSEIQNRNASIMRQQQQQQQQQYNQAPFQSKPEQELRCLDPQSYRIGEDVQNKLRQLISENKKLIDENEYYKQYLQKLPKDTFNQIQLAQQVHTLSQQVDSLKVQLQIQTDDAVMWATREKELAERCKQLYDQLQKSKGGQDYPNIQGGGQSYQYQDQHLSSDNISKIQSLENMIKQQQYQIQNLTDKAQINSQKQINVQQQQQQILLQDNSLQQQSQQSQLSVNNPYTYSSPKQREDIVQSIIKQYKLGGQQQEEQQQQLDNHTNSNNISNSSSQRKKEINKENINDISGTKELKSHDQKVNDWKLKYDSLTQKLNSLNAGSTSSATSPNKQLLNS